jgi:hypothetical protein
MQSNEKKQTADAEKIHVLPGTCKEIAIGLSFNLFLLEDG